MIRVGSGNLLTSGADALVNTVNTVGVMGKGIALQFKQAYPLMFKEYARAAKAGELQLGRMHVWETGQFGAPRFIINFPTKGHWKSPSRLADIDAGLIDLVAKIRELGIRSVAVPPLGAGNGGLDWADVEPRIRAAFQDVDGVDVILFPPTFRPRAAEMPHAGPAPGMTPGRAALVVLLAAYEKFALGATPLEVQKLMYFLQVAGEPLKLRFKPHHYGPYADELRHVLRHVEGYYLSGFGDGSARVREAEPITVLPEAESSARSMLAASPLTTERVARVSRLTEGFASMYGLELLATVHWCCRASDDPSDRTALVDCVHRWSPRKERLFPAEHIVVAQETLREQGWLAAAE